MEAVESVESVESVTRSSVRNENENENEHEHEHDDIRVRFVKKRSGSITIHAIRPYGRSESGSIIRPRAISDAGDIMADRVIVVLDQYVYDLTQFADSHPGGRAILDGCRGKDVTMIFDQVGAHDTDAVRSTLDRYCLGHVSSIPVIGVNKTK
jgi:hypothetical protein